MARQTYLGVRSALTGTEESHGMTARVAVVLNWVVLLHKAWLGHLKKLEWVPKREESESSLYCSCYCSTSISTLFKWVIHKLFLWIVFVFYILGERWHVMEIFLSLSYCISPGRGLFFLVLFPWNSLSTNLHCSISSTLVGPLQDAHKSLSPCIWPAWQSHESWCH